MRSFWEKVWLKPVIMAMMLALLLGAVSGCGQDDALPEGACYVVNVTRSYHNSDHTENMTLVYDSDGRLLREQKGAARTDYTYDDQGRLLSNHGHNLEMDVPLEMIDYTYDDAGNLIKMERYVMVEDYNDVCCTYAYDQQGNVVEMMVYDGDGELKAQWIASVEERKLEKIRYNLEQYWGYTYTEDGKLLRQWRGDHETTDDVIDYFYDEAGRLLKTTHTAWHNGKKSVCTREYSYDDQGRLRRRSTYDGDGRTIYDYTYDDAGNLISYLNAETQMGYRWEYDDRGRMTACHHVGKNVSFSSLECWVYDEAGNVIRWESYNTSIFTYTWPEGEVPQVVKDSVASYIAGIVELDWHTSEYHTRVWFDNLEIPPEIDIFSR